MSRLKEKRASELEQARAKLDGILQSLMEKTRRKSSSSQSEDESKALDSANKDASPKKIQKTQRKRRRKDDSALQNSNTYITKIYGCSVDLAQFDENSPLYSMCRSWIQNKPLQNLERNHSGEDTGQEGGTSCMHFIHFVLALLVENGRVPTASLQQNDRIELCTCPAPVPPSRDEDGNIKDLRIPSPVPQPSEKFFMASDDSEVVPVHVLLAGHQTRWKECAAKVERCRYGQ
ncbi:hypothetical protein MRX96_011518 [Rhipicephalus microplus]